MAGIANSLGLTPGSLPQYGMWLTIIGAVIAQFGLYIKGMPDRRRADNESRKIDNDANAATRRDDREDVARLTERIDALDLKLDKAEKACTTLELQVGQLNFALRLAVKEIEVGLPHSKVPEYIREILAAAFPAKAPSLIDQAQMDLLRTS